MMKMARWWLAIIMIQKLKLNGTTLSEPLTDKSYVPLFSPLCDQLRMFLIFFCFFLGLFTYPWYLRTSSFIPTLTLSSD